MSQPALPSSSKPQLTLPPRPQLTLPPPKPNIISAPLAKGDKGKGVVGESSKLGLCLQCFKCQGLVHIAAKCPIKAFIIHEENKEDDIEEVYEPNMDEINVIDDECEENLKLGCIQIIPPNNKPHESSLEEAKSEDSMYSISHVTQLAYENSITESMSPFEVKPRRPLGTLPFSPYDRTLESIGTYKHHEVRKQFLANDNPYKIQANSNYMKFQARDYVMVPSKQLQACSTESL